MTDWADPDYLDGLCDDDRQELLAEGRHQRRYERQLSAHPDCRDPDHPGCWRCGDEDEDEEE